MMKYFTLDGWINDQNIDTVDIELIRKTHKHYEEYLVSIADRLPPDLVRLHQTIRLHDAGLLKLELNVERQQLILIVDTYPIDEANRLHLRPLALQYEQVKCLSSTSDPQKGLAGPFGYGDIGGNEIELLSDGVYEHRYVFSSGIELSIEFGGFTFSDVQT